MLLLAKIVGCYIPCSINLYGCIGYIYYRFFFQLRLYLSGWEIKNIVIFMKFNLQNDGGVELGVIAF